MQSVDVTDDREAALEALVGDVESLAVINTRTTPFLAIGSHDEIADHLRECRRRWNISYFTVRDIESFAPVIERLRDDRRRCAGRRFIRVQHGAQASVRLGSRTEVLDHPCRDHRREPCRLDGIAVLQVVGEEATRERIARTRGVDQVVRRRRNMGGDALVENDAPSASSLSMTSDCG